MTGIALVSRDRCPLCDSSSTAVWIAFPQIPVLKCESCGFKFSGRVLGEADLNAYYEGSFGGVRHMQGQLINSKVNSIALDRLLAGKRIATALDVGTGYGFLLRDLKEHRGIQTTGVELSRQEAEYAQRTLGLNVVNRLLSEAGLAKGAYDLVMSFEVIEHTPDPHQFVRELMQYVKVGGYLLTMTDNFESKVVQALGAGFPKWIPHAHISHFDPQTIASVFERSNQLKVVATASFTPWELILRDRVYRLRGHRPTPAECFNLEETLRSEMVGSYRGFSVRKHLNRIWAGLTLREGTQGALMYWLCQKIA